MCSCLSRCAVECTKMAAAFNLDRAGESRKNVLQRAASTSLGLELKLKPSLAKLLRAPPTGSNKESEIPLERIAPKHQNTCTHTSISGESWEDLDDESGALPATWVLNPTNVKEKPKTMPSAENWSDDVYSSDFSQPLLVVNTRSFLATLGGPYTKKPSRNCVTELASALHGEGESFEARLEELFARGFCYHTNSLEVEQHQSWLEQRHPGEKFAIMEYPSRLAELQGDGSVVWHSSATLWNGLNAHLDCSGTAEALLLMWICSCSRGMVWKTKVVSELCDLAERARLECEQRREVRERATALRKLLGSLDELCCDLSSDKGDADILSQINAKRSSVQSELQSANFASLRYEEENCRRGETTVDSSDDASGEAQRLRLTSESMSSIDYIAAMVLPRTRLVWHNEMRYNTTDAEFLRLFADRHASLRAAWVIDYEVLPPPFKEDLALRQGTARNVTEEMPERSLLEDAEPGCAKSLLIDTGESHSSDCSREENTTLEPHLVLLERRSEARALGDFATADTLRQELFELGYEVDDTVEGSKCRRVAVPCLPQEPKSLKGRLLRSETSLRRAKNRRTRRVNRSKKRNAVEFARFLVETFGIENLRSGAGVLDVAGGKGALAFELAFNHGVPTTVVDPVPVKLSIHKTKEVLRRAIADHSTLPSCDKLEPESPELRCWLHPKVAEVAGDDMCARATRYLHTLGLRQRTERFDEHFRADTLWLEVSVVVGLHPDEATEDIVDFALADDKPFACVPCCVFPSLFPGRCFEGREVRREDDFVRYLAAKGGKGRLVCVSDLPQIPGRNKVVWSRAADADC